LKPSISVLFGFTFKKALFSAFLGFNSFNSIYNFIFFFQSVKISFNVETVSVRWQKNGSFGFAKRWLLCRAKPNVPFCAVGISGRFSVGLMLLCRSS
jgi:hypothetical protein